MNFASDQLLLTWESDDTKTYKITTSGNLLQWTNVLTGIPGANGSGETTRTINFFQGTKAFFRVEEE